MKRRIISSSLAAAAVLALSLSMVLFPTVASAHAVPNLSSARATGIYHGGPRIKGNATSQSTNWSAYAVIGSNGAYSTASGSWVQPRVTCTSRSSSYSSFWVGLDGYNSNSVEQLGTDSDCSRRTPRYYAWYEMFPNPSVTLSTSTYPVSPGDTLTASVTYNGNSTYTLSMSSSRGWHFSTTQGGSFNNSSAEWIAEAPSSCGVICQVLPLANFGTVNFSNCTANGATIGSYGSSVWQEITMVTNNGTVKAQPSALNSSGNGFSDTWHHS